MNKNIEIELNIHKTKVLLPQAYLTLAQLGYSVVVPRAPVFTLLPMTFELFSFPVDCLWADMMTVISETRRVYLIRFLCFYS
jgi:hypothetical protein